MKKLTCIFFTAVLFVSAGCKKSFFDINQNPNSPTEGSITPELIIPRAITRAVAKTATSYSNVAGYLGYWSRSGTYGPNPATEGYTLTTSFEADEWDGWYDILYDFDIAEKKATVTGQNYYVAVAKIMKSIGFMYLVDQYNNIPYSKAFDLANNINPTYDKGEDVYADLIVQLNTAIDLLSADDVESDPTIVNADIVYGGDAEAWIKLANTQKLKLLIHQSELISDAEATAELANADFIDNIDVSYASHAGDPYGVKSGGHGATDDGAYVQPGYVADNNKQNPFYNAYDTDVAGSQVNQYWRANNFILFQMYGVDGDNYIDERLFSVFDEAVSPTGGSIEAHYLGTNYGEIVPNGGPQAVNQADVSGPGISTAATQAQWLFTVVESKFLQAEAMQRGWISGNAEEKYVDAVRASFKFLNVPDEIDPTPEIENNDDEYNVVDDYLTNSIANWADNTNKIKLIATQKYIALAGINVFEAWVDYRRLDGNEAILNTPDQQEQLLSFSPDRGNKNIPLRWLYPQSEYTYNTAVVSAEGTINPQSSRIFWDRGPR